MKFAILFLAIISAKKRNSTPLDDLERLHDTAVDILKLGAFDDYRGPKFVSRWQRKFRQNTDRLIRKFNQETNKYCVDKDGIFSPSIPENISAQNSCASMGEVLENFLAWSDAFLGACRGQVNHNHQLKRYENWTDILVIKACSCQCDFCAKVLSDNTVDHWSGDDIHVLVNNVQKGIALKSGALGSHSTCLDDLNKNDQITLRSSGNDGVYVKQLITTSNVVKSSTYMYRFWIDGDDAFCEGHEKENMGMMSTNSITLAPYGYLMGFDPDVGCCENFVHDWMNVSGCGN